MQSTDNIRIVGEGEPGLAGEVVGYVNYGNIRFAQVKAAGEQLLIRVSDDFKADKVRLAFDAKDVSVYSTRIDMKLC